ncbi:MAG TPA: winged helix-turn-helix domain-containing protein [Candidatus Acidoferrum sp.]
MDYVRFDTYEVDLRAGELFKAGHKIRLQDQPFQILIMLLERPGEVVAREDLRSKLWPADTFVDFDHSLNTAIKKLRQALNDDSKNPQFIETLPKRGYRFIGRVEQAGPPAVPAKSLAASSWVGQVGEVATGSEGAFALVCVDEEAAAEREKLDAANDDIGLSHLIAARKLLLVPNGTPVRILEVQEALSRCLVRVLEGEHYGKTALIPLRWLAE